jgi:hypothetical protein
MKRILLFVLTNLGVMLVLGLVVNVLGLNRFLTANGLNLTSLLGFSLVMGFGGAFISLLISKPMAKWSMGVQVINESNDPTHAWLVATVKRFADKAGHHDAAGGHLRRRAQCLCHRRLQELGAGGGFHRPAAVDEPRRGGGGDRP